MSVVKVIMTILEHTLIVEGCYKFTVPDYFVALMKEKNSNSKLQVTIENEHTFKKLYCPRFFDIKPN